MECRDAQCADQLSRDTALFIETPRCLLIIARAQSGKILSMTAVPRSPGALGNIGEHFPSSVFQIETFYTRGASLMRFLFRVNP